MLKKLLYLFFSIFIATAVNAQEIEWQKTFGGDNFDLLISLKPTSDGGYICGGYSSSGISGEKTELNNGANDYWIVKLDFLGNVLWNRSIGGGWVEFLTCIQETSDGGFICGGYSESSISGDKTEDNFGEEDFWVVKLNSAGTIEWQNTIGGDLSDKLNCIEQTLDGGYICGGQSGSNISFDKTEPSNGNYDYWIVKLNSLGGIVWQKTIGGTDYDAVSVIHQTVDGGYICGGTSGSNVSLSKSEPSQGLLDFWILKLGATGNVIWQNTIGGSDYDYLSSLEMTQDGGFICGGSSSSVISGDKGSINYGVSDDWLVKLDSLGNIQWENSYGGAGDDILSSLTLTEDGGYICGGVSGSNISGLKTEQCNWVEDYWILRIDSVGILQWQNTIAGNSIDRCQSISHTNDNGFICGGFSASAISDDKLDSSRGYHDYWVIKFYGNSNKIEGSVFADLNTNLNKDLNEPAIKYCKIIESNTGKFAVSNLNGNYSLSVLDSGQYLVYSSNVPNYSFVPSSHVAFFSMTDQIDSLNDFAYQPLGNTDDLCMTITPLGAFRPGFNGSYMLNYENVGTTTQSPRIVFRIFPNISFVSSSVTPSAIYPDSIVWNLSSLSPFQTGQILVTINLSPTIPIGTILNSYAQIFPIVNDVNPSCNNATWEVTVTGSFDPNDISVDQDTLYSNVFPNPPYLDYLIRFQNTGTDTAFTVKILNPLDTMKLDLNSLEFVAASHPMEMRFIYHERNMEFLFNNILLPDSNVNETASHGFVRYKIKPKSNLQVGDSIKNFAAIYFDFNEPVITNTAKTDILLFTGLADQISSSELFVYPNPSSQEINIQVSNTQGKRISVDVYNLFGQKVKSLFDGKIMSSELKQQFDISSLNQGLYLLQYNVDGVTKSKKILKW